MSDETLRNVLLDAVIDGELGNGIVVSTAELKAYAGDGKFSDNYLATFLPNSEMGALTAGYRRFTIFALTKACIKSIPLNYSTECVIADWYNPLSSFKAV